MPAKQRSRRKLLNGLFAALIALALIALAPPSGAQAGGTYYVALSGNDANPGTEAAPWRTIQKAAATLSAGDTVVVQAGDYGERVQVSRSGSAGQPVTYVANGRVSMQGFTVKTNYITVRGFYITGAPNDSTHGWGVYVQGSHNTIENNHLYYNVRGGVALYAPLSSPALTSENVVRNNRIQRNSLTGVDIRGQNNLVERNEIWETIQHHPAWTNPPTWLDADGIRFHGGGHVIRHNYIHDISYTQPENWTPHIDCFQTWSDASHEVAHDVVIEGNVCKNLQTHAENENSQGFMIEHATQNLLIENNIILAYLGANVKNSGAIQIVNNTFVDSLAFTQWWPRGVRLVNSPNATVRNNIFVDVGSTGVPYLDVDSASNQGLNAGHNLVWMSDGRTPPGSPRPNDLWNVDPRFVDRAGENFHLQPDSPAIDTGIALPQVPEDGDDRARPLGAGWDRGAFESSRTPPIDPSTLSQRSYMPFVTR